MSEAFLELPIALGYGPATGPTLNTALCHIRTLVGRRINTALFGRLCCLRRESGWVRHVSGYGSPSRLPGAGSVCAGGSIRVTLQKPTFLEPQEAVLPGSNPSRRG